MTTPAMLDPSDRPGGDRLARLRDEMCARWRDGDRVPAEHYLAAHPGLSDEDALVLVVGEVLLRWELGEAPTPEEYARRFPRLADELPAQFEIQQLLRLWPRQRSQFSQQIMREELVDERVAVYDRLVDHAEPDEGARP